jgi:hypothetical protein
MPECRTLRHATAADLVFADPAFMVNLSGEDRSRRMFHHHAAERRMKENQK